MVEHQYLKYLLSITPSYFRYVNRHNCTKPTHTTYVVNQTIWHYCDTVNIIKYDTKISLSPSPILNPLVSLKH